MSTLDDSLAFSLEATLSPDLATRTQAEAHLVELHQTAQTGLALCSIVLNSPTVRAPHVRQAAALSLRRWITERWSPYHNSFIGFAPKGDALSIELKAPIRAALIQALALPERQLRLAAAYALSAASAPDWPDDAPELIPSVKALLEGSNDDAVHGAMCFLSEFVQNDLDENQIMSVSRELLPDLERLLGESQRYAASLRARALLVFRHLLETLFMVRESYPEASKQAAQDVLPRWLAALQGIVAGDVGATLQPGAPASAWEELGLRDQAWQTLRVATHFRTHLKPYISSFITLGLGSLESLNAPYATYYVHSSDDTPTAPEASEGDASISSTIPTLAAQILQFLTDSLRSEPARQTLLANAGANAGTAPPALASLVGSLRLFSRMTRDDEEEWTSDAGAFVAASDDEEALGFQLRGACADLLSNLLEEHAPAVLGCLQGLAQNAATQAEEMKRSGSEDAWKEVEATLSLLGGVAEAVGEHLPAAGEQGPFDLGAVFAQLVLPNMNAKTYPFLLGRCFVFASQYATALPTELAQQILEMSVSAIEDQSSEGSEGDVIIKLSAVRCIKNFYRHLPALQTQPFASRVIAKLGPLLAVATASTLVLIVETLQLVTSESLKDGVAPSVSAEVFDHIIGATLLAWAKDAKDIIMLAVVADLLEALAATKSQPHAAAVVQRALATLVEAIAGGTAGEDEVLVSGAVDLIGAVLRGAESQTLLATRAQDVVMAPVMGAIMRSEDRDLLQNGVDCLTLLVRKIPEATLSWTDPNSASAITSMLAIVAKLLQQNDDSESGGLAVGDLLIALLRKAPQAILSVLPDLLTALANRLVNVKTATFAQSLILPFAYLMLEQSATVLDHLETVQVPLPSDSPLCEGGRTSVSGLEILARRWVENAETFQGFWSQRVSSIALAKLLEASRASLESVVVQGDMLPDDSNVIRTRSRAKTMPHRFTQVPLPAKILKLLLVDWEHARRGAPGPTAEELAEGARTPETDDEDGEWDDEEDARPSGKKNDQFLSDLLGPGGLGALDEEGNFDLNALEDEDLANDEVYNMDAKSYLANFLASQVQRPDANARFAPYLSADEQQKMSKAVSGQ